MENGKTLKRGTLVVQEGENVTHLIMIKSGRLSLFVERNGKKTELMTLTNSQVLGEIAVFNPAKHLFSAETATESQIIEVPIELIRNQVLASPASTRLLLKNVVDEVKLFQGVFRSHKLEQEKIPCPQMLIPKIFTILNVVARLTGQKNADSSGEYLVDWGTLKIQTSRLFVESPPRMRSLLDLLLKLKLIELRFEKNEDGDEELAKVVVKDAQFLEDFSEFYQYNLYKGGRSEIIYIDPLAHRVAKAFVEIAKEEPVDRKGAVRLEYEKVVAELKARFQIDLKDTHLNSLEKKGLFVKRQATETNIFLFFDKAEYEKICKFWNVIAEIDQWNEHGFVDLSEKTIQQVPQIAMDGTACPQCQGAIHLQHKFCPHCGVKLEGVAA